MKMTTSLVLTVSIMLAEVLCGHSGATGIVKERMDAMQDMGDKSKIVADMFKGKNDFDKNAIAAAADSFLQHGMNMQALFPDSEFSRTGGNTEALPQIWEKESRFGSHITEFIEASQSLKDVAATTNNIQQLRKAFFMTTKNCSGCHKRFRKPKD